MIVYQNKNYKVETRDDGDGYNIINNVTGAIERHEGLLPLALGLALDLDSALEEFAEKEAAKDRTIAMPSKKILTPDIH